MIRALYGGSFDPVHAGHVAVVERILSDRVADRVHVVPAFRSPLKDEPCRASGDHRWRMLELALGDRPGVVLDDRELRAGVAVATVETLTALVAAHPQDRWRLIVGADHAPQFSRWREPERLLDLAEVVVLARGEVVLEPPLAGRSRVIGDFAESAESTAIRRRLARGERPSPTELPAAVTGYIVSHGLYDWPGEEAPA
jgi:nicotinate-nucleotide adenylyltransferase